MAKAKTTKGRRRSRKVRDLPAKPAGAAKVSAGAPRSKRFDTTMYTEQVKLTIKQEDA